VSSSDRDAIAPLSLAAPTGGRGAGGVKSAFTVEEFTGTARLELPLAGSVPRRLVPDLSLLYSSGTGNGPLGIGWRHSIGSIGRYTADGVPRYDERDTFVFAGTPLVALPAESREQTLEGVAWRVEGYVPRAAVTCELLERWVRIVDGQTCWRHVDQTGLTSVFGLNPQARIADPQNPWRVFEWLLEAQYDTRGEAIAYEYLSENAEGVADVPWEAGRDRCAQRYLGRVLYAPQTPVAAPPYGVGEVPPTSWHVELVLDYGQYDADPALPSPYEPSGSWRVRPDPFSRYEAGFEVRTYRRLENLMLFHRFEGLGEQPMLAHLTRLTYEADQVASRLCRYDSIGCAGGAYEPLPPLELEYTAPAVPGVPFRRVAGANGCDPPPGMSDAPAYTLADLAGEGVPGVLYADGESVIAWPPSAPDPYQWRGEGPGSEAPSTPGYGPPGAPSAYPVERLAATANVRLRDVTGDGLSDLLVTSSHRAGLYEYEVDRFQPFRPFSEAATELAQAQGSLVDLSGDGLPDLVVLGEGRVRTYPGAGAAGFATPVTTIPPAGMPHALDGEHQALVTFADVLGGGLPQLVRVSDGAVECWPSLGYGAFGERVVLGGAPSLGGQFDAHRVLLADIDGSGTADLLYVMSDRVLVYVNQSGNSFAEPVTLELPVTLGGPEQVTVAELDGAGALSLLVESSGAPSEHWACPLAHSVRPYLLERLRNGIGAETEIEYASSTDCWLADAAAGAPWVTSLPFGACVVRAVRQRDLIGGETSVISYRYRHGFYCAEDREFGFQLVDRWDAEALEPPAGGERLPSGGSPTVESARSAAPRHTRTWRCSGEAPDAAVQAALASEWFAADTLAWQLPGSSVDWGATAPGDGETVRQGFAALRGRTLREEVYGLDESAQQACPYRVTQHAHEALLVAAREAGQFAGFAVHERQTLTYQYERDASDPAIRHSLNLEIDRYGQVRKSCAVAYARRSGMPEMQPAQQQTLLVYTELGYIDTDEGEAFRVGLPYEQLTLQLNGLPSANHGCYGLAELAELVAKALAGEDGMTASTVEGQRFVYYASDGVSEAPLGAAGSQGLLASELRAAFPDAQIRELLSGVVDGSELEALLERGQYLLDEASHVWWGRGPTDTYLPAAGFHMPASTAEPWGAVSAYSYDATTVALLQTTQSAQGTMPRVVTVERFDYFALEALCVRDVNESISEVQLDPLAQVLATAHRGSELGQPVGFPALAPAGLPVAPDAATLIEQPGRYLGEAAEVYLYDLLSWNGRVSTADLEGLGVEAPALLQALAAAGYITPEGVILEAFRRLSASQGLALGEPFQVHAQAIFSRLRELPSGVPVHWVAVAAPDYPDREPGAPEIAVDFLDGFGRVVQRKQRMQADVEREGWATSGAALYNSRGQLYARCEPFFSDDWSFVPDALVTEFGPARLTTYDALDRPIRVDTPEGFFSEARIAAWSLEQYDEVDTVTRSRYWSEHAGGQGITPAELAALRQAALSAETPVTSLLDPLGNVVAQLDLLNLTTGAEALSRSLRLQAPTAAKLYGELRANGFLDFRGALTSAFAPGQRGFSLGLSPELAPLEGSVVELLEGMLGSGAPLLTRYGRDVLGRQIWSVDPRLGEGEATNFLTTYSYTGEILAVASADAGSRLRLAAASGQDLLLHDARGLTLRTVYDLLGRPLCVTVSEGAGEAETVEAYVWGDQLVEGKPVAPDPCGFNLMGEVLRAFDLAGMREVSGYSLGGAAMAITQRFLADPASPPDWSEAQAEPSSPLLEGDSWTARHTYDARGRETRAVDAAGNAYGWTYTDAGLLESISGTLAGGPETSYVSSVAYNALGQRTTVRYGNGVLLEYVYDPLNFRVSCMRASSSGGQVLVDMSYVYDPAGNVVGIEDAGLQELFGAGVGSAERSYVYDSLYRLVSAVAPEPPDYAPPGEREPAYEGLLLSTESGLLPAGSLVAAKRDHAYDAAGNLYWTARSVPEAGAWSTETILSSASNRGVSAQLLEKAPAPPGEAPAERTAPPEKIAEFFDADGNQTVDAGIRAATFDYADRMNRTAVALGGGEEAEVLRAHDVVNRLMRELQISTAGTLDVLYLDLLEVRRSTSAAGQRSVSTRVRLPDVQALVAEVLSTEGEQPVCTYAISELTGSVAVRVDERGELTSYEAYTPYGATSFAVMPAVREQSKLERYDGRQRDRVTGAYRFERRDYAPWLGRWYSPDPTGPVDGLNLYAFVAGNPVSFADVGGRVKVEVAKGVVLDVTPEEILKAVHEAGEALRGSAEGSPLVSGGEARRMSLYEATKRGDLLRLAFDKVLRGDPLTEKAVTPYALRMGTLDVTEKGLGGEPGVHGTVIVGNEHREGRELFGYDEVVVAKKGDSAEAKRLIQLFKVKTTPTGGNANDSIVPVMAISEADRSVIGGLLAMIELYNVKYGLHSWDQGFVNGNDPYFIGAKKTGGAKALKTLDRAWRELPISKGQKMTKVQQRKLFASLETFVTGLHAHRGAGKASKFAGMKSAGEITAEVRQVLVRRMRVHAMIEAGKERRKAAIEAKRKLKG
jgi:RHS repeat-associated protein